MGIADIFKADENQRLRQRIAELESMITPESRNAESARETLNSLMAEISKQEKALAQIQDEIKAAKELLVETNELLSFQEVGLYEPLYDFATSEQYKSRLAEIRAKQKDLVKKKQAATGSEAWTVNKDVAKGRKMVSDTQKLLLRAFNNECDEIIGKVKFNNIEASIKRIIASRESISKLGQIMSISITPEYYNLKIEELHLSYEYQVKKQEEKEEQKRIREELREQEKLRKEIEEARKKISKDIQHHENALKQMQERLKSERDESERLILQERIADISGALQGLNSDMRTIDYREANQKAGYVYIISNIGSFGENVYKIGMTRRLEPMDRIEELGDASVPFRFDVHAMIFSDDAPKLENALHHAFEKNKLNMVNHRREFFKVSLDEIKRVIRENYDKTVEFVDIPDAEQYRQSILIRKANKEGQNGTA